MAIHPEYANAILDGTKQVEFRKRPLATDVRTVMIYATSPVQRIVGEFAVKDVILAPPGQLWPTVRAIAGIDKGKFDTYYMDSEQAAGILVKHAHRYPAPIALSALDPEPAIPQSFTYLHADTLVQLHTMTTGSTRRQHVRIANALSGLLHVPTPLVAGSGIPNASPYWPRLGE